MTNNRQKFKKEEMVQKLKISIGIPAYNEEANIKNLLLSILSQKADNFLINEIVVISDGSEDATAERVREVRDRRIKLLISKIRMGQTNRQNQIVELMSPKSDCLLLFEADTLPVNNNYIKSLVSSIPKDKKFSMIVGETIPVESTNFFSKIVNFSINFRYTIYERATNPLNVYICAGGDLLSKEFLKNFRWDSRFNGDAHCFREAIKSGLPLVRNKNAKKMQKSVENLHDYLLQSGKFQKARDVEKSASDIYTLHYNYLVVFRITLEFLLKNPILFISYFALAFFSRINSIFLPRFSEQWDIYISSKNLRNQ